MPITYDAVKQLHDRVASATAPDTQLSADICREFDIDAGHVTGSMDAAVAFVESALPGWWWKVGTCFVSDDARVAPDYNSPVHGERLARKFPLPKERYFDEELQCLTWGPFDEGFDVDRRPRGTSRWPLFRRRSLHTPSR